MCGCDCCGTRACAKESFTGKALDIVMRVIDRHDMNITGEGMT